MIRRDIVTRALVNSIVMQKTVKPWFFIINSCSSGHIGTV